MRSLNLNTSYKHHIAVACIIGVWIALFLVVIAPFDASDLSFKIRLLLLPFYGAIALLSYLVLIPLQNLVFKAKDKWTLLEEILFLFVYTLLSLIFSFLYYKTDIINGTEELSGFILGIYYPIFLASLPVIILVRWFLNKQVKNDDSNKLVLKGDNKLDLLQVQLSELISVSSADNYVEIAYLNNGILNKKLLRTTLKQVHSEIPQLIKVHRSHLINPNHIIDWKDSNTINLTQIQVPISKTYQKDIFALKNSSLKANDSSQSRD